MKTGSIILKCIFFTYACFSHVIAEAQVPVLGIPKGHLAEVYTPDISSDGKFIVTPSADKTAKVWEYLTGRLLFSLEGHTKQVLLAKFTKDNKKIVTAGDRSIIIWDALTGKKIDHWFHGEIPPIDFNNLAGQTIYASSLTSIALSKDGNFLASGATDSSVIIWEINKGKKIHVLKHTGKLESLVFTSDNDRLVSITEDHVISYWDIKTGKFIKQLIPEAKNMGKFQLSPDEKKILTLAETDGSAYVWDLGTGKLLNHFSRDNRLMSVNWSPGGKKIIGSGKGRSFVWDSGTGQLEYELPGHQGWVHGAIFSPSEKLIVTSGRDLSIKVWNSENKKLLYSLEGHQGMINSISFSADGKNLISTSDDRSVKFWDLKTGQLVKQLSGANNEAFFGRISRDRNYFLTAAADNSCIVWDLKSAKKMHSLNGHTSWVYFAEISNDNKLIVTAATDNTARLWNLETGELLHILSGHKNVVNHAVFNKEITKLVTASDDKTARVWDIASGKILFELNHDQEVKTTAFSPDGKHILTTSFDRTARIWNAGSGKLEHTLYGHTWLVRAGEYSPDGNFIATASGDKTAILWDANNGKYIRTFTGHSAFVYKASFRSDSRVLYTASVDSTVKVWDVESGLLLQTIPLSGASVKSFSSKDGEEAILTFKDAMFHITDSAINNRSSLFFKDSLCLAFIPNGNYMGDKEMVKLLYYVNGVRTLGYDQLDVKYNRPDKVLEAMGNSDTLLIKSYRKAWEKRIKKLGIDTTQFGVGYSVPEADIVNRDGIVYDQQQSKFNLQVKGTDIAYKLDRFNVWVNEVPVFGQRGISLRSKNTNSINTSIAVDLSRGENKIETSITNVNGTESYRIPLLLNYTPTNALPASTYFIGIGIDQFSDSKYNLKYSTKDIRDLCQNLKRKYKNIIIDTLFNERVTISNIKALKQKLLQTSVNDKVIISYSGHGMLNKDFDYYLSTYAVNFDKPEENGLAYDELESLLDSIPARKKLMFIDACHSGEVDKDDLVAINATDTKLIKGLKPVAYKKDGQLGLKNSFELMQSLFVNVGKSTGATIISAAAGTQFALEGVNNLPNGVFTYCILEAMNKYPTMKISELKKIVGDRVVEITKGLQKPTSRNETIAVDWEVW